MNKRTPSKSNLMVMILFAFSCFAILLYLWKAFGGASALAPKQYSLQADFDEATQLSDTADVRISGVPVGTVVKITESASGGIRAEIEMNPRYAPLQRTVRATLRQKTLLGETYVEMTPG